ncbi:hypothetical protein [Polaribacter sp. Hel1_85]|uniref:hypothetical protein n=1 Tax=Polaribacter sp. Hel1_85 TaxID=1250005 RepID=UPI00052D8B93|nr:hypothetical protein [Polaribacter sp. Hel1_85]KGL59132.1 hypothetical protein PHEL85_3406 [Polaribacter sp. Hel1_85]
MLSIFKRKLIDVFNITPSDWVYSHCISIKDFTFQVNTNNENLNFYLKETLKEFITKQNSDYTFNFLNFKKHSKFIDKKDSLVIKHIRFFDTFFYYRQHKNSNLIDVLLPSKFENWEVENFFKIFISSVSLKHNCLLIHASAIIIDNEIVLFSGQSTAGKSTIADLSGYPIIHDDNILISYLGNEIFEIVTIPFKTPYKKQFFKGKIKGFYRLFQDRQTYVKDINIEKQLSHLIFGLWAFDHFNNEKDNNYNNEVLSYCMKILSLLKVKELYFTKTKDFLEKI